MPRTRISQLQALVAALSKERQGHVDAIAEIDAAFEALGAHTPKRPGRKPGRPKKKGIHLAKRRPKGKTGKRYAVPGPESILRFVRAAGKRGRTGNEIDKRWKSQGRAGAAYNILGQMITAGKIRRRKIKGERGSRYMAA